MVEGKHTRFKSRILVIFVISFIGYIPELSAWGVHGSLRQLNHNSCPSEDPDTHECFRMVTLNTTCLVTTIEGCVPFNSPNCKWQFSTRTVPCTVYKCERTGCCEGWVEDVEGFCVEGLEESNLLCLNEGRKVNGVCKCKSQFTGKRCEIPVCEGDCLHGGKCDLVEGTPQCVCPSKFYSQPRCENVSCVHSCENGGKCVPDGVLSRCKCQPGYQGDSCQYEVNIQCPIVPSNEDLASCSHTDTDCTKSSDCPTNQICCYDGCTGECVTPANQTCAYNNLYYKAGETFSPETCKRCICQPTGDVHCVDIVCPTTECEGGHNPISVEGHCCKICPDTEISEVAGPEFENCPGRFITINVGEDGETAILQVERLNLRVNSHDGTSLQVSYSRIEFAHSKSSNLKHNMHIVTAYSDCDSNGRRAECNFMVIVRDPYPPVFTSCPMEIFALDDEEIDWSDPVAMDNVEIARVKAVGDEVRNTILDAGTYSVSYTVWDFDQNQAICAFAVHVLDKDADPKTYPKEIKRRQQNSKLLLPTIIGFVIGLSLLITGGIYVVICFTRRRPDQLDGGQQTPNMENHIYAVLGHNTHSYENILGKLPTYSPPTNPPAYEDIDHSFETPPIYEEIDNNRSGDEHSYANIDSGHSNPSFQSDSGADMKYMKI